MTFVRARLPSHQNRPPHSKESATHAAVSAEIYAITRDRASMSFSLLRELIERRRHNRARRLVAIVWDLAFNFWTE